MVGIEPPSGSQDAEAPGEHDGERRAPVQKLGAGGGVFRARGLNIIGDGVFEIGLDLIEAGALHGDVEIDAEGFPRLLAPFGEAEDVTHDGLRRLGQR